MLNRIRRSIRRRGLLSNGAPVVVAFSGGADSVALLSILSRLGYRCIAAHCNFHLRGDESERDEAFAQQFAQTLNVPFYKADFDTRRYAQEQHLSIEMAARDLRYQWLENLRQQTQAQAIAVAHHRDDNIETFLLNLLRGAGLHGLRGIPQKNGFIVRPLLDISRHDLLHWLQQQHIPFVTDSSNYSDVHRRNLIRHRLIPLLEQINPSAKDAIARALQHLTDADALCLYAIEQAKAAIIDPQQRIDIPALLRSPAPRTLLYDILAPFHFNRPTIESIFRALTRQAGKTFFSPTHRLVKDRTCLLITPRETLSVPAPCLIPPDNGLWRGPITLHLSIDTCNNTFRPPNDPQIATLDYDKLHFPLTLRHWHKGDWFIPLGMNGRKKLSDYFADHKYSLLDKERALLLCSGEHIIWLIGRRIDERFKVTPHTRRILTLTVLPPSPSAEKIFPTFETKAQ